MNTADGPTKTIEIIIKLAIAGATLAALNASHMGKLAPNSSQSITILCVCLGLYPAITACRLIAWKIQSS